MTTKKTTTKKKTSTKTEVITPTESQIDVDYKQLLSDLKSNKDLAPSRICTAFADKHGLHFIGFDPVTSKPAFSKIGK